MSESVLKSSAATAAAAAATRTKLDTVPESDAVTSNEATQRSACQSKLHAVEKHQTAACSLVAECTDLGVNVAEEHSVCIVTLVDGAELDSAATTKPCSDRVSLEPSGRYEPDQSAAGQGELEVTPKNKCAAAAVTVDTTLSTDIETHLRVV